MTDKPNKATALIYKETESHIKDIAFNRRALEILGEDAEEFDREINGWCEKYYDYFKDADEAGLSKYMFEEALRMLAN